MQCVCVIYSILICCIEIFNVDCSKFQQRQKQTHMLFVHSLGIYSLGFVFSMQRNHIDCLNFTLIFDFNIICCQEANSQCLLEEWKKSATKTANNENRMKIIIIINCQSFCQGIFKRFHPHYSAMCVVVVAVDLAHSKRSSVRLIKAGQKVHQINFDC